MAKVLVTDTNLTNIANAIREKNGKTTNYKVDEMASAIRSVSTGGGATEDLSSELSTQNSLIATQEATIDNIISALEGKASGGSGSSVETCTITMKHYPLYNEAYAINKVIYQTFDDSGNVIFKEITNSNGGISYSTNEFTLSNVICPSIIYANAAGTTQVLTGCTKITGSYGECVAKINGTGSIEFQPTG